jgi:hypothetical protein
LKKWSMVLGARGSLEMTELDTVAIRQRVHLWSGVQQPATMFYNEGLYLLIGKTLPARLTGFYSSLIPGSFGHGKRLLSSLNTNNLQTYL